MDLKSIKGIGPSYEKRLRDAGISSIEKLAISDVETIAAKTGIPLKKIQQWKEEARKMTGVVKAEIIEDINKIAYIHIEDGKARVRIKNFWHNAKIFEGKFEEVREEAEKENVSVYLAGKPKLWFNGKWYDGIPYKIKRRWLIWRK